jgi:uncharacterized protein (TIGR02391 family)
MKRFGLKEIAQIEYHGRADITQSCINAIVRLLAFGDPLSEARLLTNDGFHCFLIVVNECNYVAIKKGFSSGYPGEGPKGLSLVLQLLDRHKVDIDEFEVDAEILNRIDGSCLLRTDLDKLLNLSPIRPMRWHDYIFVTEGFTKSVNPKLRKAFPLTIPYGLIDDRIIDLAIDFDKNPDAALLSGFRRLEDLLRNRTGLDGVSGTKLFSRAFQGESSILTWQNVDTSEQEGLGALFPAIYKAFRNRRAHQELDFTNENAVREFLLVNELFLLEAKAVARQSN